MRFRTYSKASILLLLVAFPIATFADALIVSQAMFASTITEYFVEKEHVRVELEIGMSDLDAFRNLLPDAIFLKLGYEPEPINERLRLFFERDFSDSILDTSELQNEYCRLKICYIILFTIGINI